ncbi:TPA: hypothetical protein DIC20_00890 [Candidatus Dependentiae bacterium]|nr:MAG: hypothetical protein US03_C0015G0022 [candidate division TM6 bacterium GW2011_GWF2_36_131]KKQ02815.1 MAG: hypothetical protein US13_C0009G0007 [candidate division TM6 bacterium GW2011_GWE2_36_25]KKQ18976.1 MAG: hypothetical protein US32_C0019G0019 [candidate division TM6 bacterium GW2011_GWA2_36_9]HBR70994.1 hypothetical protein [Candidatus Dependentiae bacterium]HCU00243.1 hypothetical protein [Candidatus Dependentiae bacterium]
MNKFLLFSLLLLVSTHLLSVPRDVRGRRGGHGWHRGYYPGWRGGAVAPYAVNPYWGYNPWYYGAGPGVGFGIGAPNGGFYFNIPID